MKKIILASLMLSLAGSGFSLNAASSRTTKKRATTATHKTARPAAAAPAKPAATLKAFLLDNFETPDWNASSADGTTIAVDSVEGVRGNALRIKYDLKATGQWVQIGKGFDALYITSLRDQAIDFQVKGTGAANNLEVKLVDADGSTFGYKKMRFTNQAEWHRVRIKEDDFTYWWGGDKSLGAVKEIDFAISSDEGKAGEVVLDDLMLVQLPPSPVMKTGVIDEGGNAGEWTAGKGEGSDCYISSDAGAEGKKAVSMRYTIPDSQWASMRKKVRMTLAPTDVLLLSVKLEGGPSNLEFKVIDQDDSTFGKVFEGLFAVNGWQKIRIPVSDLKYMWGGDNQLDMEKIQNFELAVSGSAAKGRILVDSLSVVK